MKKTLLLFTFLVAAMVMPVAAQGKFVKKRVTMQVLKKRGADPDNMLGIPKAATVQLGNQVLAGYYPTASSGIEGKENYYLVLSDKDDVAYDVNEGTISATSADVAILDLYANDGAGMELPVGTFASNGDGLMYDADYSFVQKFDDSGNGDDGANISGDITVAKNGDKYTISFGADDGTSYVFEGEISLTNMSVSGSTVYPQITADITDAVFTGGLAYYYGNLMESNTGNMVLNLYSGDFDSDTGGMTGKGLDLVINLYNRLFGDPTQAEVIPGVYTMARNFHKETFYPGMEIDYMGLTVLMGTYVKRRKAVTGLDSDYDYCYIADGTITITEGEKEGTFDVTVDCVTDRGYKVTGTAKGVTFPVTDMSEDNDKDVDSNLTDDVALNFSRVSKSRIYSLGYQNGCQIFSVDLGSPSGQDDPDGKGDQDLLRMEFQTPNGSKYLPEGTYTLMEQNHTWTNLYSPFQLTRGYFTDLGGRTGTRYEHFRECPDPETRLWWVVDRYATVYAGTVGVTKTDDTHYKFVIDLYDGNGFKIYGSYDSEMEYFYDPTAIEAGISGIAADGNAKAEVYSMGGQLLKTVNATPAESVTGMPAGVYIVKSNNKTTKIVKK